MSAFKDPRVVGGQYYRGYWRRIYTVVRIIRGPFMTIRWEDNGESTCHVPWDMLNDRIVFEPRVTA